VTARCYDGCWDSKTQAQFDKEDALMAEIRVIEPQAHCTRFPEEQKFQVHVWGRPLSEMRDSRETALREALTKLKKENES
jgi:hypothetical protein